MPEAYVALGSNLGDRLSNVGVALRRLDGLGRGLVASSVYETKPSGFHTQPSFLNAACKFWTTLSPWDLLSRLREIEADLGRRKTFVNGPRPIDLDVLLYVRLWEAVAAGKSWAISQEPQTWRGQSSLKGEI